MFFIKNFPIKNKYQSRRFLSLISICPSKSVERTIQCNSLSSSQTYKHREKLTFSKVGSRAATTRFITSSCHDTARAILSHLLFEIIFTQNVPHENYATRVSAWRTCGWVTEENVRVISIRFSTLSTSSDVASDRKENSDRCLRANGQVYTASWKRYAVFAAQESGRYGERERKRSERAAHEARRSL